MVVHKSIRDLFSEGSDQNPTLQQVASEKVTVRTLLVEPHQEILAAFTSRLPGQGMEDHPMVQSQLKNPFYGSLPFEIRDKIRAKAFTPAEERDARKWMRQFPEILIKEPDYSKAGQYEAPPGEDTGSSGLRRADPWPYDGS
jgi:hypothetical protein